MNAPQTDGPLTLVLATGNQHKVAEIQAILGSTLLCRSLREFPGAPRLLEEADSFAGNAAGKARQLAAWLAHAHPHTACLVLADDSGLEVDALNGAPGVRSARFAAKDGLPADNTPDRANNSKLLRLLSNTPAEQRGARFHCVLALVDLKPGQAPGEPRLFRGTCEGRIGSRPAGQSGFGYDPLFLPEGFQCTFAELGEEQKNRISHRRKALDALGAWLARRLEPDDNPTSVHRPSIPATNPLMGGGANANFCQLLLNPGIALS